MQLLFFNGNIFDKKNIIIIAKLKPHFAWKKVQRNAQWFYFTAKQYLTLPALSQKWKRPTFGSTQDLKQHKCSSHTSQNSIDVIEIPQRDIPLRFLPSLTKLQSRFPDPKMFSGSKYSFTDRTAPRPAGVTVRDMNCFRSLPMPWWWEMLPPLAKISSLAAFSMAR